MRSGTASKPPRERASRSFAPHDQAQPRWVAARRSLPVIRCGELDVSEAWHRACPRGGVNVPSRATGMALKPQAQKGHASCVIEQFALGEYVGASLPVIRYRSPAALGQAAECFQSAGALSVHPATAELSTYAS